MHEKIKDIKGLQVAHLSITSCVDVTAILVLYALNFMSRFFIFVLNLLCFNTLAMSCNQKNR